MSTLPPLAPIVLDRSRHAAPQVFEILREKIINLELTPNTVLARNELAQLFNISQTPIRDALLKLSAQNLVDIFPQHATTVSKINIAKAKQALFLRRSIELEVVLLLSKNINENLWLQLQQLIDQQKLYLQQNDLSSLNTADKAFHRLMHKAVDMDELWILEHQWSGHLDRLRRLHLPEEGKGERIINEHQNILDAIRTQDSTLAQDSVRHHLSGTLQHLENICLHYPNYVVLD